MLRIRTSLVDDKKMVSTTSAIYEDLEDAIHDAARAAGSIVTDDIIAGRAAIAIKLLLESEECGAAATIEVSATVTRQRAAAADEGDDHLLEM